MLIKPWGGAFTFPYYPKVGGEALNPPTQTPTIYIFSEKPDNDNAQNNTNGDALETISSWTETKDNYRPFTVAAIADPADGSESKHYFAAINYVPVTSGSSTVDIQVFQLERPSGHTADTNVSAEDVKKYANDLATYYPSSSDINEQVDIAETEARIMLSFKGYEWAQIKNPEDLRHLVIYGALEKLWLNQSHEPDDRFYQKYEHAKNMKIAIAEALRLEYDADKDRDLSEAEKKTSPSKLMFIR